MNTDVRSAFKNGMTTIRRWMREKPRQAVAAASAVALVALSAGALLSAPKQTDVPPPADTPQTSETDIFHAPGSLDAKLAALKKAAISDSKINETLKKNMGYQSEQAPYVVFFSATAGKDRAMVVSGTGKTVEAAWKAAEEALQSYVKTQDKRMRWVRADVVTHVEMVSSASLAETLADYREGYFRQGIAFDGAFKHALLEAELNAASVIDYEEHSVSLQNANIYLANAGREGVSVMPNTVLLFTTAGYFCDENDDVVTLSTEGSSYGRREVEAVDKDMAIDLVTGGERYLVSALRNGGRFFYGYLPASNRKLVNYNMVRHCGTIWSLCQAQQLTGDDTLQLSIDQAIEYMKAFIATKDSAAYVLSDEKDEISLGANALAILALTEYGQAFDTKEYDDLVTQLAAGILSMQNSSTGQFTHVLNSDYTVKKAFSTVYYDGEATFALVRAYARTKEERFLDGAKKAADWMVEEKYEQHGDHWVAYAMNELTKYAPDEAYFTLGLKNAQENMEAIRRRQTTSPTSLELLMATFEMVDRIETGKIKVGYLSSFNEKVLFKAIGERAQIMLDGYFYPETAMYMVYPQRVAYTFFVRQDRFRVRIDDVQHNMGAYYAFIRNYEKWQKAAG